MKTSNARSNNVTMLYNDDTQSISLERGVAKLCLADVLSAYLTVGWLVHVNGFFA